MNAKLAKLMLTAGKSDVACLAVQLSGKRCDGTTDEKGGTAESQTFAPCWGGGFFIFALLISILIDEGKGRVSLKVFRKRI
jgi:hypothetical protein